MADRLKEKVALAGRWPGGSDYATRSRATGTSPQRYVSRMRLENAMAEIAAGSDDGAS